MHCSSGETVLDQTNRVGRILGVGRLVNEAVRGFRCNNYNRNTLIVVCGNQNPNANTSDFIQKEMRLNLALDEIMGEAGKSLSEAR